MAVPVCVYMAAYHVWPVDKYNRYW